MGRSGRRAPGRLAFAVEIREISAADLAGLSTLPAGDLPTEWELWADEPHRTLVAVRAGGVVGAVHTAVVGPSEGWVEGLQVRESDPSVEDGLVLEAAQLLRSYGVTVVRSAAPVGRAPAWVARHMREVCRFQVRVGGPSGKDTDARLVAPKAATAVGALLEAYLRAYAGGLVPLGWRWRSFRTAMAQAAARERRLFSLDSCGAVLFLRRGEDRLVAAVTSPQPQALVAAVRWDPGAKGRIACFVPHTAPEAEAFQAWPPHPWCPDGVVVYEAPTRG